MNEWMKSKTTLQVTLPEQRPVLTERRSWSKLEART